MKHEHRRRLHRRSYPSDMAGSVPFRVEINREQCRLHVHLGFEVCCQRGW